jgi:hypothetical protein
VARIEFELRNLPRFRVREYLVEAGGGEVDDLTVTGAGWTATLTAMPPAQVGSFAIPRDLLVIAGDEDAVARVSAFMRQKTMRGGG